jgi:hypothetical protein
MRADPLGINDCEQEGGEQASPERHQRHALPACGASEGRCGEPDDGSKAQKEDHKQHDVSCR